MVSKIFLFHQCLKYLINEVEPLSGKINSDLFYNVVKRVDGIGGTLSGCVHLE